MSNIVEFHNPEPKKKSFWQRPEGVTGMIFLIALLAGAGFLLVTFWGLILTLIQNTLALFALVAILGVIVYIIADPKTRALLGYMYKSAMRAITGMFVQIDPIGILKSYIESLQDNIVNMRTQIGKLRGQMRHLQGLMETNNREIDQQLKLAAAARDKNMEQQMILSSRKAARLRESNAKYQELLQKMEVLYRILIKMHENSEVLLEDTKDQVALKEQERKAIRASHSAMKSAMSIMSGDPDQRAMFDMAMEAVAEDVANKVGEMERFMEMSSSFMNSVDLQNGIFEEEGLKMLEKWEKESTLLLMGEQKAPEQLELKSPTKTRSQESAPRAAGGNGNYDSFFS